MPRRLLGLGLLFVGFGLACSRPVDSPTSGATLISDVLVEPHYVRDDRELSISFRVTGVRPAQVTYDLGGRKFDCAPETIGDGRLRCSHPGVARNELPEGTALVVVEARDEDGQVSLAADQIIVDFGCPGFVNLSASAPIASPGQTVTVVIEANESLRGPPRISRAGVDWGPVVGEGRSWSVSRLIGPEDPALGGPIAVRLEDQAGNSSADCSADGALDFKVDQSPPVTVVDQVMLTRDAPGSTSVLSATAGAFTDDVGIAEVRVHDETGTALLATVHPAADGALPPTSLGGQTSSRVVLVAIDRFGRSSPPASVPERWRLSVGTGASPGAALRTAVRWTPAPPDTTGMRNRTFELAPDVFAADARTAIIRARVGFERVGQLPARYEGINRIMAGYEPVGKAIVAAGGYDGTTYNFFDEYVSDVLLLHWDERDGVYSVEQGPNLSYEDPTVPFPRYGFNMAFDGQGCGVLYGGDAREAETDARIQGDAWQLCYGPAGYEWTRLVLPLTVDGLSTRNILPIVYDRANSRYMIVGGTEGDSPRALILQPGADERSWQWFNLTPLPTNFSDRYSHFLYYDPVRESVVLGSGTAPGGGPIARLVWTYRGGQWTSSELPFDLSYNTGHGAAYDEARRQLVFWGGIDNPTQPPRPETWFLTDSSTVGVAAWRSSEIDHPVARSYPTMVYDSEREVVVAFGGVRFTDAQVVAPEIYQVITQPSRPFLQATVDLAAARPKGIQRLHLQVRASGIGDGDGVRPGTTRAGGFVVHLWDHRARRWDVLARSANTNVGFETLTIDVTNEPERYVGPTGQVPITITTAAPSTEAVDGRLEVDLIDGALELRAGVMLP